MQYNRFTTERSFLMKRILSFFMILAMLMSISAQATVTKSNADIVSYDIKDYQGNEFLVMYENNTFEIIPFNGEEDFSDKLNALKENEEISLVQPNYSYTSTALSVADPLIPQQWALENDGSFFMEDRKNKYPVYDTPFGEMKPPGQWENPYRYQSSYSTYSSGQIIKARAGIDISLADALSIYKDSGRSITVAIIDTGIDYTHSELSGRIWKNTDEVAYNGIDDDNNGYADDIYGWNFYDNSNIVYNGTEEEDHGTHGAGTIVAKSANHEGISGIVQSSGVKVMIVKALGGSDGTGSTESVIKAIHYAEKNGASICNMSLGTSNGDKALYETIKNSNMLFVAAAGNDGENTDHSPCYPASFDVENMISVANLSYDGTLHYSSNYGTTTVDLAAPGTYIISTSPRNGYTYMTGTSMSAPMVSAAAALIYSHFPTTTLADVKEIILSSVTRLDSLTYYVGTGGYLNLGSALSFNLNNLSGKQWEVKIPISERGNAPVITTEKANKGYGDYLNIQVTDEDNDIDYVSYVKGIRMVDYFNKGNVETKVALNAYGSADLTLEPGIYTFFATDKKGNKTVQTITFETSQPAPSTPSYPQYPGTQKPTTSSQLLEDLKRFLQNRWY